MLVCVCVKEREGVYVIVHVREFVCVCVSRRRAHAGDRLARVSTLDQYNSRVKVCVLSKVALWTVFVCAFVDHVGKA